MSDVAHVDCWWEGKKATSTTVDWLTCWAIMVSQNWFMYQNISYPLPDLNSKVSCCLLESLVYFKILPLACAIWIDWPGQTPDMPGPPLHWIFPGTTTAKTNRLSSSPAMIFQPPNVCSKNPPLAGIQIQSGPRFPIQSVLPQLTINEPQDPSLAI